MSKNKDDIKIVQKSDIILAQVYCADEYFDECHYAIFNLNKKIRNEIKALRSAFKIMKMQQTRNADLPGLYKMSYWALPWGADFLHDQDMPKNKDDEDIIVLSGGYETVCLNKTIKAGDELRCETNLIHVYDDGIRFDARIKNTNVTIETALIDYKKLGL